MDGTTEVKCELTEEWIGEVFEIEEDARGEINCRETEAEQAVVIVGHEEGTVEKTGLGKHSHNDCRILYAAYVESKMERWKGFKERLLDGWVRRGMPVVEKKKLSRKVMEVYKKFDESRDG